MRQINRSVLTPSRRDCCFATTPDGIPPGYGRLRNQNEPLRTRSHRCDYCRMTDTTNSPDASATPTKTPLNIEVDSAVTHTAEGDDLVSIELSGCPNPVPRMLVHRNVIAEGRFKIPFRNGYDHFVFESYATRDGQEIPVFVWTGRTRVAE